jgi:hypothetical protein
LFDSSDVEFKHVIACHRGLAFGEPDGRLREAIHAAIEE